MPAPHNTPDTAAAWPRLSLAEWKDSYATLHLWTQMVGKTRLALAPRENHWWEVALYVTSSGLTTSPMPYHTRSITIDFDLIGHALLVRTNDGASREIALRPRTVADFYAEYLDVLRALGIQLHLWSMPVEIEGAIPLTDDETHGSYDSDAVHRWWQALVQADRLFKRFRARFIGKASPVHFFWGSFDLATTRFSGRRAPPHVGSAPNVPDSVMREAYSHEEISAGFWPGGGTISDAAFYAYAYPEPEGLQDAAILPAGAYYDTTLREFILPYELVRTAASPDDAVEDFLDSTYAAAAHLAHWDRGALERDPGQRM
ncbi:MAG TPA: DUF5996 family protein [Gemmatimonadaceae bacterium]|nr:DUF5996 family protein [Gemmatimonadaceae bacterium]